MRAIILALAVATLPAAAYAHHGWASYDSAKQTKLTAKIDKVAFTNPHGEIWMTVEGKQLYVLLSPPGRMVDRGLNAKDLTVGKTVTVEAQPSTVNAGEWKAVSITVDGKNYNLMR
jgi:hypothetical protein